MSAIKCALSTRVKIGVRTLKGGQKTNQQNLLLLLKWHYWQMAQVWPHVKYLTPATEGHCNSPTTKFNAANQNNNITTKNNPDNLSALSYTQECPNMKQMLGPGDSLLVTKKYLTSQQYLVLKIFSICNIFGNHIWRAIICLLRAFFMHWKCLCSATEIFLFFPFLLCWFFSKTTFKKGKFSNPVPF